MHVILINVKFIYFTYARVYAYIHQLYACIQLSTYKLIGAACILYN